MPRAHCPKRTGPPPVASWPLSPATGNRPAIARSGPLDLATGNRTGWPAAGHQCPWLVARGPWLGTPGYRVKTPGFPPKIQNFRAAAHVLASAS